MAERTELTGGESANSPPGFVLRFAPVTDMLSSLLWPAGLLIELLLLVRSVQTKTFTKYIYFYAYISCVFVVSAGLFVEHSKLEFYEAWYWPTQFATLAMGCAVVLEIAGCLSRSRAICAGGKLGGVRGNVLLRGVARGAADGMVHVKRDGGTGAGSARD
jgi:hypothetical protein